MPCIPYTPQQGFFYTTLSWGSVPNSGNWSFRYDRTQGSYDYYQLKEGGVLRDELMVPTGGVVRWIFFQNNSFLAVSHVDTAATITYRIFIFDLRSTVSHYEVSHGPYAASSTSTPQLHFQPSQDGTAFFVFIGLQGNQSNTHRIIRTDNGDLLCGYSSISVQAQRMAEVTANDTVTIFTSPAAGGQLVWNECPLPSGELKIYPNPQTFPDAVVGGDPSLASTKKTYTLKNDGDDCLTVSSVTGSPPFTPTDYSRTLPAELSPSDTMTVEVTFSPNATGYYGPTHLTVTRDPAKGDDKISSEGNARSPNYGASVSPSSLSFGTLPIGSTDMKTFTITNTSEAPLHVSLAAPSLGSPYMWTAFDENIPYGGFKTVSVSFTPPSADPFNVTLNIQSNDLPSDLHVTLSGAGREPIKSIIFVQTLLDFETVQVGATSPAKSLTMTNNGEVTLNVTVAGPPPGSAFSWNNVNQQLNINSSIMVAITFSPVAEGSVSETLMVNSEASTSPDPITLTGNGCIPRPDIESPPEAPIQFGQVQQGFRTVRYVKIQNTGSGLLTFRARITGDDSPLFGLQPPTGSIIDVQLVRDYYVYPELACGSGPTGAGEALVAVAFHAEGELGQKNASLVIENHNDTLETQGSWTYPLNAEITSLITVDAALVLDRSGSMSQMVGARTKSDAAVEGGKLFARLMRADVEDRLTIVKYNELPNVVQQIIEVTSLNQDSIVGMVNPTELAPSGFTSIAAGIMAGLDQLSTPRDSTPPDLNKVAVVLTDGKDNRAYLNPSDGQWYSISGGSISDPSGNVVASVPIPTPPDTKVYGIGLGKEENIDKARLNQLSMTTGAYFGVIGDLEGQSYFDLEKYYTQIYMDVVGTTPLLDPVQTVFSGQEQQTEFDVSSGDRSILIVVYDFMGKRLPFHIVSPKGEIIEPTVVPPGFQLRSGATDTSRFIELKLPTDDPDRCSGRWAVVVRHTGEVYYGTPMLAFAATNDRKTVTEKVSTSTRWRWGFVADNGEKTESPVTYGVSIGVGSNFKMEPFLSSAVSKAGEAMELTVSVSDAGIPIKECAVSADVVSPSGKKHDLMLEEDKLNIGAYRGKFTNTSEVGFYNLKFRLEGRNLDGEHVVRESMRGKYVEGRLKVEPTRASLVPRLLRCCRRLAALLGITALSLIILIIIEILKLLS